MGEIPVQMRVRRVWLAALWIRCVVLLARFIGRDRAVKLAHAGAMRLVRVDAVGLRGGMRVRVRPRSAA